MLNHGTEGGTEQVGGSKRSDVCAVEKNEKGVSKRFDACVLS